MVTQPDDYRWSSFRSNAGGLNDPLISPHPLYLALDDSPAKRGLAYRALFDRHLESQEIRAIREATETGAVLGNDRFKESVEAALSRRVVRHPHGGDRKSERFRERQKG